MATEVKPIKNPYYVPNLNREQCEELLHLAGPDTFLFRDSSRVGHLVLSYCTLDAQRNTVVTHNLLPLEHAKDHNLVALRGAELGGRESFERVERVLRCKPRSGGGTLKNNQLEQALECINSGKCAEFVWSHNDYMDSLFLQVKPTKEASDGFSVRLSSDKAPEESDMILLLSHLPLSPNIRKIEILELYCTYATLTTILHSLTQLGKVEEFSFTFYYGYGTVCHPPHAGFAVAKHIESRDWSTLKRFEIDVANQHEIEDVVTALSNNNSICSLTYLGLIKCVNQGPDLKLTDKARQSLAKLQARNPGMEIYRYIVEQ